LRENKIDLVFTAGTDMAALADILPGEMQGGHAGNSELLVPVVRSAVRAGDAVSIKGSAGSKMNVVVQALLALDVNMDANNVGDAPLVVNGG